MKKQIPNQEHHTGHDRTQRVGFWLRVIELRKQKLAREYRRGLSDVAREGVSDEDYATTLSTLEAMARNLGWDEEQHPFDGHRGFSHKRGRRHPAMLRGFHRMPHPRPHHSTDDHSPDGTAA